MSQRAKNDMESVSESVLINHLRTQEESLKLLDEIDLLLNSLYEEKGEGFELALKSKVRSWVTEAIREEMSKGVDMEEFLKSVKNEIASFKELKISLAFEPTSLSIEKIYMQAQGIWGRKILLNLSYDPNLIAGCVIIFEGEYRDFSLRKAFKKEFLRVYFKLPGVVIFLRDKR